MKECLVRRPKAVPLSPRRRPGRHYLTPCPVQIPSDRGCLGRTFQGILYESSLVVLRCPEEGCRWCLAGIWVVQGNAHIWDSPGFAYVHVYTSVVVIGASLSHLRCAQVGTYLSVLHQIGTSPVVSRCFSSCYDYARVVPTCAFCDTTVFGLRLPCTDTLRSRYFAGLVREGSLSFVRVVTVLEPPRPSAPH